MIKLKNKRMGTTKNLGAAKENSIEITDHDPSDTNAAMLRELVSHLRQNRTQLREEWARRITHAELLTAMTDV